jgi:hypothetical protein
MTGIAVEAAWHGDEREVSHTVPLAVLGAIEKRFGVAHFYAEFRDGDSVAGPTITADVRRELLTRPLDTVTGSLLDRDGVDDIGYFSIDCEDDPAFLFLDLDDPGFFDIGSASPLTLTTRGLLEDFAASSAIAVSVRPQDVGSYLSGDLENEPVFLYYYFRNLESMLEVVNELIEASREYVADLGFDLAKDGPQVIRATAAEMRLEDVGFPGRMARQPFIPHVPLDLMSLDEINRICEAAGYRLLQRIPFGLIFEAVPVKEAFVGGRVPVDLTDRRETLLPRLAAYLAGIAEKSTKEPGPA